MPSTPDSKAPSEKAEHLQRECVEQDETPEAIDARKKEDALRRKLDCYVAPVMMMLMLISYLDRGNIGFAATQGMTTDIKLKGSELNVILDLLAKVSMLELTMTRLPCRFFTYFISSQR
jgi:hypothetical protein